MKSSFEWDPAKDLENRRKRGVAFSEAQAIGAGARRSMNRTPKYTNEPIGRAEILEDFLPPPDKLVMKEDGVKVTISLSRRSVEFFKAHAAKSHVPYQRMIRSLLDGYASKYEKRSVNARASGQR